MPRALLRVSLSFPTPVHLGVISLQFLDHRSVSEAATRFRGLHSDGANLGGRYHQLPLFHYCD